jgi:SAM domain (Sterile alpha motif)
MLSTCEQPNWGFASGGVVNGSNRHHSGRPTLPTWTRSLPGTIMRVEPCAGTTMMNVAQWLNAIDLGHYEALFREHEIDADVLPDLVEAGNGHQPLGRLVRLDRRRKLPVDRSDRLIQRVDLADKRTKRAAHAIGDDDLAILVETVGSHALQAIGVLRAELRYCP